MFEKQQQILRAYAVQLRQILLEERFEECWNDQLRPGTVGKDFAAWMDANDAALRAIAAGGTDAVAAQARRLATDRDRLWLYVALIQLSLEAAHILEAIGSDCEHPSPGPEMMEAVQSALRRAQEAEDAFWPRQGWHFSFERRKVESS